MAVTFVTDATNYTDLFRRRVVTNVQYWLAYIKEHTADVVALDNERDRIVKAVSFGLDLKAAWPYAYEVIVAFSPYMERRGHWESWNWLLSQALRVAQQINDSSGSITLLALRARLLQRQGQSQQAISHYRRAIWLARQTENRFEEARACTNLGYLFIEQDCWYRAEVLCCYALTIFESIKSDHGRAHTENHLGFLYTRQGRWDKAQQRLERACEIWQTMGDNHGLLTGLINLSALYCDAAYPDQLLPVLEKALSLAKLTGEKPYLGKIYNNMGLAYTLKGQPDVAEKYGQQAEAIFQRFSDQRGLGDAWETLGKACLHQQKWPEADRYFRLALDAWRSLQQKYDELQTMTHLVELELARGNQPQASAQLKEVEARLSQADQSFPYQRLREQVDKLRRSLTG